MWTTNENSIRSVQASQTRNTIRLYHYHVSSTYRAMRQARNIQGNPLSEEEISICKMLYDKMQGEIALAKEKFILDKEEQS